MNKEASTAIILLLKGIFYKGDNESAFYELVYNSFGAINDYFKTIGLEVIIEESDGYAYLKQIEYEDDSQALPKLIASRPLSYKVSLLLVLLRKRLAEFDMQNENERAIVTKDDIISMITLFVESKFNEVKVTKEIEATIKKVEELGFLKRLKTDELAFEIMPSLKAFVDAQWLDEFDKKLQEYKEEFSE